MFIYSFSFKKFEETTEDQNNSEMIEGKNLKSLEKPKEFKERCVFRNSFLLLAFIQKNISIFTQRWQQNTSCCCRATSKVFNPRHMSHLHNFKRILFLGVQWWQISTARKWVLPGNNYSKVFCLKLCSSQLLLMDLCG